MIFNETTAINTAEKLLQIKAIKLQPSEPFTWASGWKSPIYCDNRIILSHPAARDFVKQQLAKAIAEKYPEAQVIAGVATGAIAMGVLVAQELNLPFVYVRPTAKSHGRQNQIEGQLQANQKVVVIEDLISTGGSSLKAVDALRQAKAEVLGMAAVFTYGFDVATANFEQAQCELFTLSNYHFLIEQATSTGSLEPSLTHTLENWRKSPSTWSGV